MASSSNDGEAEPCCYSNFLGTVCPLSQGRAVIGFRGASRGKESVGSWVSLETLPFLTPWTRGPEREEGMNGPFQTKADGLSRVGFQLRQGHE